MIDGNLLQTAQRSFDFEGRVAVKSTVKRQFRILFGDQNNSSNTLKTILQ